jgi:hypothetical protein
MREKEGCLDVVEEVRILAAIYCAVPLFLVDRMTDVVFKQVEIEGAARAFHGVAYLIMPITVFFQLFVQPVVG